MYHIPPERRVQMRPHSAHPAGKASVTHEPWQRGLQMNKPLGSRTSSSSYGAFYNNERSGGAVGGNGVAKEANPAPAPVPAEKPRVGVPHPLVTTSHASQANKAVANFWDVAKSEPSEQKKVLNRTIARKNRHVGTASSISYDGMLHTRYGPNKPAPPSPYVSQYHLKYNDGVSVHFDDRPPEKPKGAMRPSSAFEVNQQAVHNKHVSRNTSITLVQEMNPHHPRPSSANRSYYHGAFTTR